MVLAIEGEGKSALGAQKVKTISICRRQ
ncbi:uncharacterized protein G2W53_023493 [Senna tora]|uniref:Uncharacterized protein n=1 Tax=Senna tora TaxID=362788 RepID=A0A834T9M9_9FABA|nr:uncharacterized protein G2W53_023493 [Senna tora]